MSNRRESASSVSDSPKPFIVQKGSAEEIRVRNAKKVQGVTQQQNWWVKGFTK